MPATSAKKPAAKKKKKHPDCPFLFYGYEPAAFNDGPYVYEARFKQPLSEVQVEYAAKGFEHAVADSAVEASGHTWQWSGPWIALRVEPAEGCDVAEMHADIRMFFQVLEAWSLEEVVFHGVRMPGTGTRDALTVEAQAEPSTAPNWPGWDLAHSYYGAKQSRVDADTRVDDAFEAIRASHHKPRDIARPGEPALVRSKPREPKDAVPAADLALLPDGFHTMFHAGGRTWAGIASGDDGDVWWIDNGKVTKLRVPGYDKLSVSEDGTRALVISHDEVREIVPPSTKLPAPIFSTGDAATIGASYAADDTVAMLDFGSLVLFARKNGKLVEVDRVAVSDGTSLGVFRGGTIAVVTSGSGLMTETLIKVFRIANRKLTEVATFNREGVESFALDGTIYVATLKCVCELTNV